MDYNNFITLEEFENMKVSQYDDILVSKDMSCPECGLSKEFPCHLNEKEPTPIGWCDTNYGFMAVFECPFCFTKFRFHISTVGRYDKDKFYSDFALLVFMFRDKKGE